MPAPVLPYILLTLCLAGVEIPVLTDLRLHRLYSCSAGASHSENARVERVRGSEFMMITETGMVHYAGRFRLKIAAVTEKNAYALIIRPMH